MKRWKHLIPTSPKAGADVPLPEPAKTFWKALVACCNYQVHARRGGLAGEPTSWALPSAIAAGTILPGKETGRTEPRWATPAALLAAGSEAPRASAQLLTHTRHPGLSRAGPSREWGRKGKYRDSSGHTQFHQRWGQTDTHTKTKPSTAKWLQPAQTPPHSPRQTADGDSGEPGCNYGF